MVFAKLAETSNVYNPPHDSESIKLPCAVLIHLLSLDSLTHLTNLKHQGYVVPASVMELLRLSALTAMRLSKVP